MALRALIIDTVSGAANLGGADLNNVKSISVKNVVKLEPIAVPAAISGKAQLFIDESDGALKVIFSGGNVQTLATDT